jgi:hypothetical protein
MSSHEQFWMRDDSNPGLDRCEEALDRATKNADRLAAENARLRAKLWRAVEAIRDALPPMDIESDWWCPTCKQELSGFRVTYQERCDTCGTWLPVHQPESDQIKKLSTVLAENAEMAKEVRDE